MKTVVIVLGIMVFLALAGCRFRGQSISVAVDPAGAERNIATVRISGRSMVSASVPRSVLPRQSDGIDRVWDLAVLFSRTGKMGATIEHIALRYMDPRGKVWSPTDEIGPLEIAVPPAGNVAFHYSASIMDDGGGWLVVSFSGQDAKGVTFQGFVSTQLLEGIGKATEEKKRVR